MGRARREGRSRDGGRGGIGGGMGGKDEGEGWGGRGEKLRKRNYVSA